MRNTIKHKGNRMRALLMTAALITVMSGSAFAKDTISTSIPLTDVEVSAEKCLEALEKGSRSIPRSGEIGSPWQNTKAGVDDRFWYDGMGWEGWYSTLQSGWLVCRAMKPVMSKAITVK